MVNIVVMPSREKYQLKSAERIKSDVKANLAMIWDSQNSPIVTAEEDQLRYYG